jgi:xylan 1,4-beta-xylosidase
MPPFILTQAERLHFCCNGMVKRMKMSPIFFVASCVLLFGLESAGIETPQSEAVSIMVHSAQSIAPYKPIWNDFGADEPNFLYAPNGKKLLHELAALSPTPVYFRCHNLLTSGDGSGSLKWGSTNVYTEKPDGTPVYDFSITDRIFDTLVESRVRPLVEIGFMPEALSIHPEPYRHTFPKGSIFTGWSYPPRDWNKWSALVTSYVVHLRKRYGAQTTTWLWEVWNEPDIGYWHGTPEEYDRLYDVTSAAIRKVLPRARIGGPEATGISDHSEPFLRQFLAHCAHGTNLATGGQGAPLDFISYHPKGNTTLVDGHVVMSLATQLHAVERGMKVIASDPVWHDTPILLGESDPEGCAACTGAREGYRNGPLYGVSVAEATMRTYELARHYRVHVEGVVTWAFEEENEPAFAGFRVLATNGIDKAVLNVFRLMGMLGGGGKDGSSLGDWVAVESSGARTVQQIVKEGVSGAPDVDAVATRNGHEVDVLLWNYHDADVAAPDATVQLTVDGLHGKALTESEFRVDAQHSNAFQLWKRMGSPGDPTPAQLAKLQKASQLDQTIRSIPMPVLNGAASIRLNLPRQGVVLLKLIVP